VWTIPLLITILPSLRFIINPTLAQHPPNTISPSVCRGCTVVDIDPEVTIQQKNSNLFGLSSTHTFFFERLLLIPS
jgi:hypothetical protein